MTPGGLRSVARNPKQTLVLLLSYHHGRVLPSFVRRSQHGRSTFVSCDVEDAEKAGFVPASGANRICLRYLISMWRKH